MARSVGGGVVQGVKPESGIDCVSARGMKRWNMIEWEGELEWKGLVRTDLDGLVRSVTG